MLYEETVKTRRIKLRHVTTNPIGVKSFSQYDGTFSTMKLPGTISHKDHVWNVKLHFSRSAFFPQPNG